MKQNLFFLPLVAGTLVIVSGCQSVSHDSSKHTPAPATPASAPTPATTASATQTNSLPTTIRINAGVGAVEDSTGISWIAEAGFSGGDVIEQPDLPIANTAQPEIYRSEHYSMDSFAQKLANGKYQVKLHFCETFEGITAPGERVFSFDVEGGPSKTLMSG